MGDPRGELFATLGDNDKRFPNIVYFKPVLDRRSVDYVSVHLDLEWPSDRTGPLLFNEIADEKQKLPIFNLIYSLKSYLERALMTELDLIEIRTGCIKVVFRINDPVQQSSVVSGLDSLLKNKERYRAFEASARVGERKVY